jgi:hypothetical protein
MHATVAGKVKEALAVEGIDKRVNVGKFAAAGRFAQPAAPVAFASEREARGTTSAGTPAPLASAINACEFRKNGIPACARMT